MVELREITRNNFDDCIKLKVSEAQKEFVATNIYSLAQAWVYYKTAFPFAIYAENNLVGFIMAGYYEPQNRYNIWRFMIDERYQSKGYGKAALLLAISYLKEEHGAREIFLSVVPENTAAKNLYHRIGFQLTGEMSGSEVVMRLGHME